MKLRTRFVLFSVFLTAVVVVGTSYSTLYFLKKLVLQEMESNQKTLLENLKKVCEESQISKDDIFAYNYVKSLEKTVKGLAYAVFVDTQRQLLLGKNDAFSEALGSNEQILKKAMGGSLREDLTLKSGKKVLSFSSEISSSQGRLGSVYLGFFEEKVEENIRESIQRIKRIIYLVGSVVSVIGFIISLIFAIQLTRPINKLSEGAKAIGEGNLDTQIDIKRKDEIGFLAEEFNIMAVKLKELDQLKDAFVSSVSHELRSPLTAISGYVELLTMKPINEHNPDKVTKALLIIQESTTRLTHFVNDVLDAAKIKAGKMEIHKSPFDVRATSESVVGLFMPLFDKKKIAAKLVVADGVPVVPADGEKVRQVITNFLSNAMKFTPEGGSITVSVNGTSQDEFVTISVKDTGIGIPKQHQHLLFGRFQQIPGSKDKVQQGPKGTGLGLVIAKGIVEAHGGKVWFESEEGKGTTFCFPLPVKGDMGDTIVESKKLA